MRSDLGGGILLWLGGRQEDIPVTCIQENQEGVGSRIVEAASAIDKWMIPVPHTHWQDTVTHRPRHPAEHFILEMERAYFIFTLDSPPDFTVPPCSTCTNIYRISHFLEAAIPLDRSCRVASRGRIATPSLAFAALTLCIVYFLWWGLQTDPALATSTSARYLLCNCAVSSVQL
jgi:hypothetical protein